MSTVARELIATLYSVGGNLRVLGGRVRVEAPAPLPSELMERLRAVKGEVFALLASGELGLSVLSDAAMVDAVEERAALAADRAPACYLEAWARLNHRNPTRVSQAQWQLALDDGGRFLDQWGCEAAQLGWTPAELLAKRKTPKPAASSSRSSPTPDRERARTRPALPVGAAPLGEHLLGLELEADCSAIEAAAGAFGHFLIGQAGLGKKLRFGYSPTS